MTSEEMPSRILTSDAAQHPQVPEWRLKQLAEENKSISTTNQKAALSSRTIQEAFKPLSFDELLNYQSLEEEWLVQNIIAPKKIIILSGASATFKSWLGLSLGLALALGSPFLDNFQTKQCGVLFIDRENSIPELQKRAKMIFTGLNVATQTAIPFYFLSEQAIYLDTSSGISFLENFIREKSISLVIIDVLRRVTQYEENSADAVSSFFQTCLKPICEKTGVAFLLLHHHKKGKSEGDSKELLRGSSDLVNFVDGVIQVLRRGDTITIIQAKSRGSKELEPFSLAIETDEISFFRFNYVGKPQILDKLGKAIEILLLWLAEKGITEFRTKEAQEVAFSKGIKKVTFFAALDELEKRGEILKVAHGCYKRKIQKQVTDFGESSKFNTYSIELLNKLSHRKSNNSNSSIELSEQSEQSIKKAEEEAQK